MKPLFFILTRSFKNIIKKLLKKPVKLIIYILLVMFFISLIVLSIMMPTQKTEMADIKFFEMFLTGILFFLFYTQMKFGIKQGSTFFRQADIQYLFVSPISPKKILTYGLIKQMYKTMIILVFILFQGINLRNMFNISATGLLIFFVSIFIFLFFSTLLSLIIYMFTSKSIARRNIAIKSLDLVAIIFLSGYVYFYFQSHSFIKAFEIMASSAFVRYFPVVGAFKSALMYAVLPIDTGLLLNALGIALYIIGALVIIYFLNPDYFEDVLDATVIKEKQVVAKKEKRIINNIDSKKIKKVKSDFTASGAKTVFQKHLLEYRKNRFYFIDKVTLMLMTIGFLASKVIPGIGIKEILFMTVYFLFLYSMQQGKWIEEINRHYIYLIPDKSFNKVFYGLLAEIIKNTIDACFAFALLGFLLKTDMLTVLLCILSYSTYAMIFLYADVVATRLFGKLHGKILKNVIKVILIIIVVAPAITLSSMIEYGALNMGTNAYYISFLPIILINTVVIFIFMMIGKGIFEVAELD